MLNIVKQLRLDKGLTQVELAELSDVSQKTISALEVGRIKEMTYRTAIKLSEVLECKPEVLLGFDVKKKKKSRMAELAQKLEE